MAVGFPAKTDFATGDVLTATNVNDITGTLNLLQETLYPAGRNVMINGAMDIWQRGTSFTAFGYTADRWYYNSGAIGRTVTRQASALTGFNYCLRAQRDSGNTATNALSVRQSLETSNSLIFAGKTVTISFWARAGANYSAASNGLVAQLKSGTGTDQNSGVSYTGEVNVINQTATLTTSWQRFSYTGTVGSTATELSLVFIAIVTGTAGAADYFEVTGVQVEAGSTMSPFQTASGSIGGELALCQRYYWRQTGNYTHGNGVSTASTTAQICVKHPVTMRVAPTSLDFSTLGIGDRTNYTLTVSAVALYTAGVDYAELTVTNGAGATTNRPAFLQSTSAAGYLGFSAEL